MNENYYQYDSANQLIREDNTFLNKTLVWTYDDGGNITSYQEYAFTLRNEDVSGEPITTRTYTYGDSEWGDLLTAYNGVPWSYDGIGNLTNDGTWSYTWQNGRELASMSNGTTTWNYTYDANGMRTSRSNGSTTYTYVYNGSQLVQMTKGSDTLYFTYGAIGPTTVTWNGTTYYYAVNPQGDVVGIFDGSGNCVVTYNWDNAWGYNPEPEGSLANTLGTLNPLRYRSYVYDEETGLYYLQSRYYNPEVCRFINADVYATTGQGLLGNNMFAYCLNNPVNGCDPCGTCFHRWDFWNDCEKCGGKTIGNKWDDLITSCESAYRYVTNHDVSVAQTNLKKDGFTFYKGVPVFSVNGLGTAAASFGIILLGSENLSRDSFKETLNHEYGHRVHMQQIGAVDYFFTTAVPSLIGAAIANNNTEFSKNYYNQPGERIADYLGGVNRSYLPNTNTIASAFWIATQAISWVTPF